MLNIRNANSRFAIDGDFDHFQRIVDDMKINGGDLSPSDHWNWNLNSVEKNSNGYTVDLFNQKYSNLEKMLDPWVGSTGMQLLSSKSVTKYETFLQNIDNLHLLPEDILHYGGHNDWRETDLGTILDLNLISAFEDLPVRSKNRFNVLEVGGGYGRLAEAFLDKYRGNVHYVMVDAVPGSLMYAFLYLRSQFPDLKIGSFYAGDPYSDDYDCFIVPAWHTDLLRANFFDISINIESMQEMQQHHVDFYLKLFDRLALNESLIYLSNARDYVFLGNWNIPTHWQTLYLNNTPRSWSADHPTHILKKLVGYDFENTRLAHEGAFSQQVINWKNSELIREQLLHIADRDRICGELQCQINNLRNEEVELEKPKLSIFLRRRIDGMNRLFK